MRVTIHSADYRRRHIRLTKAASAADLRARRAFNKVLRDLEPRLAVAFGRAVQLILDQPGMLRKLTQAIRAGDLTGAEDIVGAQNLAGALRGEGLSPKIATFQQEVTAAMVAGGVAGREQLKRQVAFDVGALNMTNPEALRYLRETLPTTIRFISEESQRAVQSALLRGFEEGRPATLMAREIRNSVGLTQAQGQAVINFRRQMETGEMIGKAPGTRRLNAIEQNRATRMFQQARDGSPASQVEIDAIVDRYHKSLVNRRAKNIARTETTRAFGQGQASIWDQAVERGLIDPAKTRRKWLTTPDERLRESHASVPGMNPDGVGLNEPFNTVVGPVIRPRESDDAGFNVSCRCAIVLEFDE